MQMNVYTTGQWIRIIYTMFMQGHMNTEILAGMEYHKQKNKSGN
jgi:hypothetical protein